MFCPGTSVHNHYAKDQRCAILSVLCQQAIYYDSMHAITNAVILTQCRLPNTAQTCAAAQGMSHVGSQHLSCAKAAHICGCYCRLHLNNQCSYVVNVMQQLCVQKPLTGHTEFCVVALNPGACSARMCPPTPPVYIHLTFREAALTTVSAFCLTDNAQEACVATSWIIACVTNSNDQPYQRAVHNLKECDCLEAVYVRYWATFGTLSA